MDWTDIDRKLNEDHASCLADHDLIERARSALPALKDALRQKSREVQDFVLDTANMKSLPYQESYWRRSGGEHAYGDEIGLQNDIGLLERLVAGAPPSGWEGWIQREEVERALRRAARGGL